LRACCKWLAKRLRPKLEKNPKRIDVKVLEEYPAFQEFRSTHRDETAADISEVAAASLAPAPSVTPEEQIEHIYLAAQTVLRAELLERILQNSPSFFEGVIVDLLVAMGYGGSHRKAARQLGRSGDGGVDGVIDEDRLGLDRVYVQAKRYAQDSLVGRPEVQAFVGSLVGLGATKGVFVTTSKFSQTAMDSQLTVIQASKSNGLDHLAARARAFVSHGQAESALPDA
jgi:restriction system protein